MGLRERERFEHRLFQTLTQNKYNYKLAEQSFLFVGVRSCLRPAALQSELDLQISVWLEHPEAVAIGIYWRQFGLRVALFHIEVGQDEEDEAADGKSGAGETG